MDQAALANLGAFALQVCLIVAIATLALRVLPIASAGTRYTCWRVVLLVCLVMPFVLHQTASLSTNPGGPAAPDIQLSDVGAVAMADSSAVTSSTPADPPAASMPWDLVVALVVAVGVIMRTVWLAIGLRRLRTFRRQGTPVDDGDYAAIQATLGTGATLISVDGLTQPATFGVLRPVILLPATLAEAPPNLRAAVVTHELFHVQRRDWLWVLAEEAVRTLLWFHPAIAWLTSRIQLTREEVVDELTVLAIGNRRAYIEALLAFADGGRLQPAPAFARRRHLFARILRLSREKAMSSSRIVLSSAVVIGVVLGTSWSASRMFPILAAASVESARLVDPPPAAGVGSPTAPTASAVPQGPRGGGAARPGPLPAPAPARPAVQSNQVTPENPIPRRIYSVPVTYPQELQGSGISAAVEVRVVVDGNGMPTPVGNRTSAAMSQPDATWLAARSGIAAGAAPTDVAVGAAQLQAMVAAQRASQNAFVKAALESIGQWRYDIPAQAPLEFSIAVSFAAGRDGVVTQSNEPRGVSAVGGRVSVGTLSVTGNALDPAGRLPNAQLAEIDRQQLELAKKRGDLVVRLNAQHPDVVALDNQLRDLALARERLVADLREAAATPAPSAAPGAPIRVGGNVRPPMKTKHVNPVYPPDALAERVQGVVIMEVIIGETGQVSDARVLRSIPLLDDAALAAVRQWEFSPTLLNGAPVAVIMTVTVQFSLN